MKKILSILAVLAFWACGEAVIEKPDNLIEEDKMVDILYDLSLIDAIKSHNPGILQSAKEPNKYIYKKYKIDSLQFAQSNRYYATDLKRYKKIYQRVGTRLTRDLKSLDSVSTPVRTATGLPEGGTVK